jgi:hypothetical protein
LFDFDHDEILAVFPQIRMAGYFLTEDDAQNILANALAETKLKPLGIMDKKFGWVIS